MFSPAASAIFAVRNTDKAYNGDIGRSTVAAGQMAGLVQEGAKGTGIFANAARSTLSVGSNLAKQHKIFDYAGKFTKFAADNVNPLICVSGALKTLRSDDKVSTGITETAALSAMFAGEALTKNNYQKITDSKTCKNLLYKAEKNKFLKPLFHYLEKYQLKGKAGSIIKALTFVAASMTSYTIGQKMGCELSDRVKASLNIQTQPNKINHKT